MRENLPTEVNIIEFSQRYMDFLKSVGAAKTPEDVLKLDAPFHPLCRKRMNDVCVAQTSAEFLKQLADAKKIAPVWVFKDIQIYPHQNANAATISYRVSAEGFGNSVTLKTIEFAEDGYVKDVIEVCASAGN